MKNVRGGGRGSRKHGRNEAKCRQYKSENRRDKNKLKKQIKIQKGFKKNKSKSKEELESISKKMVNNYKLVEA